MTEKENKSVCPARVETVELSNFRGWGGVNKVKLDADLVLVSAANGRGKSSLLEALARALGGTRVHLDDTIQTIRKGKEQESGTSRDDWSVKVTWKDDKDNGDPNTLEVDAEGPVRERDSHRDPGPETIRRATLFTQDPLDDQFEQPDDGDDTLIGFLAPFPGWMEEFEKRVSEAIGKLESQKPDKSGEAALLRAERKRDDVAAQLAEKLPEVFGPKGRESSLGTSGDKQSAMKGLRTTAHQLLQEALSAVDSDLEWSKALLRAIEEMAREQIAGDDSERTREIIRRRDEAVKERDELDKRWPPEVAGALAEWFRGETDLDRLLDLLSGLAEAPLRWQEREPFQELFHQLPEDSRSLVPRPDEIFEDIANELRRVDSARSRRAFESLSAWKEHWTEIIKKRDELERVIDKANEELRRLKEDVARLEVVRLATRLVNAEKVLSDRRRRAEEEDQRINNWPRVEACLGTLRRLQNLCNNLREEQVPGAIRKQVQDTMNSVMKHFVVAGIETAEVDPIQVDRYETQLIPQFTDGRRLTEHFSTGQKAQDALAWLLSTNALLQRWLPHKLLLLDDLSTALDLTNLAAECALLRKFAYSSRERKRQVVLASHHDQLTNRIFALMLPPEDFTMCELQLVDWDLDTGPEVERFRIKSTAKADDEARKMLADALGLAFKRREHEHA